MHAPTGHKRYSTASRRARLANLTQPGPVPSTAPAAGFAGDNDQSKYEDNVVGVSEVGQRGVSLEQANCSTPILSLQDKIISGQVQRGSFSPAPATEIKHISSRTTGAITKVRAGVAGSSIAAVTADGQTVLNGEKLRSSTSQYKARATIGLSAHTEREAGRRENRQGKTRPKAGNQLYVPRQREGGKPLFRMVIETDEKGSTDNLVVCQGDDPKKLGQRFAVGHKMSPETGLALSYLLEAELAERAST